MYVCVPNLSSNEECLHTADYQQIRVWIHSPFHFDSKHNRYIPNMEILDAAQTCTSIESSWSLWFPSSMMSLFSLSSEVVWQPPMRGKNPQEGIGTWYCIPALMVCFTICYWLPVGTRQIVGILYFQCFNQHPQCLSTYKHPQCLSTYKLTGCGIKIYLSKMSLR